MAFKRLLISELTLSRLYGATKRRIADIPHILAWYGSNLLSNANKEKLLQFRNRHVGQRCFILGNGPSLSKMDLGLLNNEVTFGLNRVYLLFEQMQFMPTYYVSINELVLEQFSSDIQALPMPKFLNWNCRSHFDAEDAETSFLRLSLSVTDGFTADITQSLDSGGTVTFVALQIAFFMGFSDVILIGVDHSFTDSGTPNAIEIRRTNIDENHFHPNYFPKGFKWQLPDLLRSEIAYEKARTVFEENNRRIIDATVNGKCPVFEKADFYSLF